MWDLRWVSQKTVQRFLQPAVQTQFVCTAEWHLFCAAEWQHFLRSRMATFFAHIKMATFYAHRRMVKKFAHRHRNIFCTAELQHFCTIEWQHFLYTAEWQHVLHRRMATFFCTEEWQHFFVHWMTTFDGESWLRAVETDRWDSSTPATRKMVLVHPCVPCPGHPGHGQLSPGWTWPRRCRPPPGFCKNKTGQ